MYVRIKWENPKSNLCVANMGFETLGFDDLAEELERLGKIDRCASEMLNAAAPILEKDLKEAVRKEADSGYATGALVSSIKANKPSQNKYGHYVSVTARGKDKKGVRNNEKLAYLNYGTQKQAARPVIAMAVQNAEDECLEAMQRKFDEVMQK